VRHHSLGRTYHAANNESQASVHHQILDFSLFFDIAILVSKNDAEFTADFQLIFDHGIALLKS
jgi:hypothetical protein